MAKNITNHGIFITNYYYKLLQKDIPNYIKNLLRIVP